MAGWSDELVRVQQEKDGSYLYEITETETIGRASTLQGAKDDILLWLRNHQANAVNNPRLLEIKQALEKLQKNKEALEAEAATIIENPDGILATELLEEIPKFDRALHLFEVDHPLERFWGDILTIAIIARIDRDDDGDLDIDTVLHSRRIIDV